MLNPIVNDPLFGLGLTVLIFYLTKRLFQWKSYVLFNPMIVSPLIIITLILSTDITFEQYNDGAQVLTYFLGPATVALAIPFYKNLSLIKRNLKPIFAGTMVASVLSVLSVIIAGKAFGITEQTLYSMVAKGATAPIAIGITESLGGLESLTILSVVITGIFGGIIGAELLKLMKVKSRIAIGLTLGLSSHAGGTARAFMIGQTEGTFSGLAMVMTGIGVAIFAPVLINLLL